MTTTYRVIRTSMCTANAAAFVNYDTTNINVAHQLCGDYNNFYCRTNCGCIFSVIELEISGLNYTPSLDINTIQPITITLPNNMWTTAINPSTTTATWQYVPSTIADGATLIYDNNLNKWTTTNTNIDLTGDISGPTATNTNIDLTGDISGPTATNTVRVATDPDIKF